MGLIRFFKKQKKKILQLISHPLKEEAIATGLKRLGLRNDDVVFIHSSLSKFGKVEGGPKTILDGVVKYFSHGTVLFPGFNILGSGTDTLERYTTQSSPYDYRVSIPTTGVLCRVFKTDYCTDISIHPTHSVLGIGKYSKEITMTHLYSATTFGPGSPFAKLLEFDAKIVGLGSDFGHVTFVHTLEDLEKEFPIQVYEDKLFKVFLFNEQGEIVSKNIKAHRHQKSRIERPSGTFIRRKFWNDLKKSKKLRTVKIGRALCWQIGAKDFYEYLVSEMKEGRTIYSEAPTVWSRKLNEILGWIHEINR